MGSGPLPGPVAGRSGDGRVHARSPGRMPTRGRGVDLTGRPADGADAGRRRLRAIPAINVTYSICRRRRGTPAWSALADDPTGRIRAGSARTCRRPAEPRWVARRIVIFATSEEINRLWLTGTARLLGQAAVDTGSSSPADPYRPHGPLAPAQDQEPAREQVGLGWRRVLGGDLDVVQVRAAFGDRAPGC